MFFRLSKLFLLFFLTAVFVLLNFQSDVFGKEDLEEICEWENLQKQEKILAQDDYRLLLEKCQKYCDEKIALIEQDINKTEQEKKTLQNKIYTLRNKIKNLDYQIYQGNLMIKDLGFQVESAEESIDDTSLKIDDSKEKLADILRTVHQEGQKSLVEILLSEEKLSGFFDNLIALEVLNSKNQELLENIKNLKSSLKGQKQSLEEEKGDLENLVTIQTLQKQENAEVKSDQEYFLRLTEAEYQKSLNEKQETEKKASEIRARIFELVGVPEAPTFGEALNIAKYAESVTGVRPALLLATLTQESNIGKNVGQCYLRDFKTGSGVISYNGKKISRVMKPDGLPGRGGDVPYFLEITKETGRDPKNTLVSCPMSYGWGGAMGPAQFIPSTWAAYKGKVKAVTGEPADPWNIKDAFLAAAFYLADYGAAQQTYNAEWRAAMIYFSGTTNTKYRFYGDSVMSLATRYQKDIDALGK